MAQGVIYWKGRTEVDSELTKNYVYEIPHLKHCYYFTQLILTEHPEYFPEYKIIRKFFNKFLVSRVEYHKIDTWLQVAKCCEILDKN